MTKLKNKNGIIKGVILLFVLTTMLGGILGHILTAAAQVTEDEAFAPNVCFDYRAIFSDPVTVNIGIGSYKKPTAYVYYGRAYNNSTGTYMPILNRVLDYNNDNAGGTGAMFVLAENVINYLRFSPYSDSQLGAVLNDENSYVDSSLVQRLYGGGYTAYETAYVNSSTDGTLPQELDYIRRITKADNASIVDGYFGFSTEDGGYYWTVVDETGKEVDSLNLLDGSRVFPLSVEEVYAYLGTTRFNSADAQSVYIATDIRNGTTQSWWLRTAIGDSSGSGDHVGIVDANGNVTYGLASDTLANRNAFNIETEDIAFVECLGEWTYRLAFNAPEYKSGAQFAATLVDVKDGTVTVEVSNHIGKSTWSAVDDSCISFIVTDKYGNAKYYSVAETVSTYSDVTEKLGVKERFSFDLPECYEQGDKIKVFWERKSISGQSYTSYVSNMVDLGCIHTTDGGTPAYCDQSAVCGICRETYGEPDENSHMHVVEKWMYNEDNEGTHSRYCPLCDVAVYTEKCAYGPAETPKPTSCEFNECNYCGNVVDSPSLHYYGENGVCTVAEGEYHYEMPELVNYANIGFTATVHNVGEWNALAEWLNGGGYYVRINEIKSIVLAGDLDFTDMEFIPLGTEERPVKNLDIVAHDRTISGISYTADGTAPVGIIGVGENVTVHDLIIKDCSFRGGAEAGAVAGKLTDTEDHSSAFSSIAVINVSLDAPKAGGIVGTIDSKAKLSVSFIYNATSGGENLDFSYDGNIEPTSASDSGTYLYGGCYRLADESNGIDAFTAEEFKSGLITYRLRHIDPKWRQTIGEDDHPRYAAEGDESGRVYMVISCDGEDVTYINENISQISHGDYIGYDASSFEWVDGVGDFGVGFSISAVCGLCEKHTPVTLEAKGSFFYSYSRRYIARSEFDAYFTLNGEQIKVNEEPLVIYATGLEEYIGMTPVTVKYDGSVHYADVLFGNIRDGIEYGRDFTAYFLDPVTGERLVTTEYDYYGRPVEYPDSVSNVGVYSVLIVGEGGYEGYEYVYENVFEITRSYVTLNPLDLNKIYDGNASFEAEYELIGDEIADLWFDISVDKAPSAKIGKYELRVKVDINSHSHGNNIVVTLARDTVTAVITPALTIEIENASYPERLEYGDTVPTPTAAHFKLSADAQITYQWFTAKYSYYDGYYPEKEISAPKNAGDYVLRVRASSKDGSMISSVLDIPVQILPKKLHIELTAPEGAEKEVKYEYDDETVYLYILDPGEQFSYEVSGFVNGETLESTGIKMEISLSGEYGYVSDGPASGQPVIPSNGSYTVSFYVAGNENYESDNVVIYVAINTPDHTYPVETDIVTDGDPVAPNVLITGPAVGFTPSGEDFDCFITVRNSDGDVVLTEDLYSLESLSEIYLYNASSKTYYDSSYGAMRTARGVFTRAGEYTVTLEIRGNDHLQEYEYSFEIEFYTESGEKVDEIVDFGMYTVKIINSNGTVKEALLYAKQKIVMNLKPHEYNVSEGTVKYDPKKVVMEAGNVIHLEHTLTDVYFDERENDGLVYVSGIKVVDKNGRDVSRLYEVETERPSWPSHTDTYNVCHVFDNPCDSDCNVYDCEYVRAVEHAGGVATCQRLAVCDNCGFSYGEYSTERHVDTHTVIYPNIDDLEVSHLVVHSCCGMTKETVDHTHVTPATCTERAVCSECGWTYGDFDPNNHSSDVRTYKTKGDHHEVTHTCCGLVESEAHTGGTAYCNALAICEKCLDGYGELDAQNHAKAPVYLPLETDASMHEKLYECCGNSNNYLHFGGDATCNALAICTDCKTGYGELEPHDHASEELRFQRDMDNPSLHDILHACCDLYIDKEFHSGGVANCQSPAICELCNNTYGEKDYRVHASTEYSYYELQDDPELHVKVAACCGEFAGNETHTYGDPTCTHAARCACGKEQGEVIGHVYDNDCDAFCNTCGEQTRAAAFHVGKDGKPCEICGEPIPKEPMSGGGISAIVTASTVTAATGGFALFWFVIKKKSLAELLAILLK